jgi:hypothetical protein
MVIKLGEKPTPKIQPAEPPPGGVDAVDPEEPTVRPVVPDLTVALDRPVAEALPDEIREPEQSDDSERSEDTGNPASEPSA